MNGLRPERLLSRETLRLLPVLAPVVAAGGAALAAAVIGFALAPPTAAAAGGLAALGAVSVLAEAFPVPVAAFPAGTISLSAIFIIGAGILYGWPAAAVVGLIARTSIELVQRRPLAKLLFNGGLYTISGLAAGVGSVAATGRVDGVPGLFAAVLAGSAAFCLVNVPLVVAIVSRASRQPFRPMLRGWVGWTAVSFGVMASVSLMLCALWQRSPALAVALVGPLTATALYQRSMHQALGAMQLALTDPLTGLGNHRHFHEDLLRELDGADGTPVSLFLLDLDDFKRINDTYGHPAGDHVLARVASCLRSGGEAYRLGGDEFALLLPGLDVAAAESVAHAVLARLTALEPEGGVRVTFSGGLAAYPRHASERSELLRVADVALYNAKRAGKNQLSCAGSTAPALAVVAG